MSVEQIIQEIDVYECRHAVVTGGEPMLFPELLPLCEQLTAAGLHITVETAGTLSLPIQCNLMSISPKLSNSDPPASAGSWVPRHQSARFAPEVIRDLTSRYEYQLKFVIADQDDVDEVIEYLKEFPTINRDRVMLMPEGISQRRLTEIASWLQPICLANRFRFCPRRHIEWYGSQRAT